MQTASGRQSLDLTPCWRSIRTPARSSGAINTRRTIRWDYDGMATPILVDATIDGKAAKAGGGTPTATASSTRSTATNGQFIYAIPLVEGINWTTGLDPKTGKPTINEAMKPKIGGGRSSRSCPGSRAAPTGSRPPMIRRSRHVLRRRQSVGHGADRLGEGQARLQARRSLHGRRLSDVPHGRHDRPHQGDRRRQQEGRLGIVPSPLPLFSGMLATKGGVLFTGDQRGRFLAYDAKTGKELWKFQTGSGINASPMTYELDGKQYVAILSGLGGDPSFYYSAPKGGMLWVFAIDGKVDEGDFYNRPGDREDAAEAIAASEGPAHAMTCRLALCVSSVPPSLRRRHCRFALALWFGGAAADEALTNPFLGQARRDRGGPRHLSQQVLHLPPQRRRRAARTSSRPSSATRNSWRRSSMAARARRCRLSACACRPTRSGRCTPSSNRPTTTDRAVRRRAALWKGPS